MKKNVLVLCGSSYQIIVAIRIIEENYKNDNVYLVLMDTIADVEKIYNQVSKESYFAETYLWKVKGKFNYSLKDKIINSVMRYKSSINNMVGYKGLDKVYDVMLYSNISPMVMHTAEILYKKKKQLSLEMFEDGFSTYSDYIGNFMNKKNLKTRMLYRIFTKTSCLYVFNEKILSWIPDFRIKRIFPTYENDCLELVNRIFSYHELQDDYSKKVIFFEESYAGDGKAIDDIELLNILSDAVGKNNVMVKIHPRNSTNRFLKLGYSTNKNINIPWEVILLNEDFSNTVFVTIASNAAMNPFFLFNKKIRVALLMKCTEYRTSLYEPIIEYDEKLCGNYPEIFTIPNDYEEYKKWIDKYVI